MLLSDKGRVRSWEKEKLKYELELSFTKCFNRNYFVSISNVPLTSKRTRTPNKSTQNAFFVSRKSSTSTNNKSKRSPKRKQKKRPFQANKPVQRKSLIAPIKKQKIRKRWIKGNTNKKFKNMVLNKEESERIISQTKHRHSMIKKKVSKSLEYVSMKDICS